MERADYFRGRLLGMTALFTEINCAHLGFASPAEHNIEVNFNKLQSKSSLRAVSPTALGKGSICTSNNALLANKHLKFFVLFMSLTSLNLWVYKII